MYAPEVLSWPGGTVTLSRTGDIVRAVLVVTDHTYDPGNDVAKPIPPQFQPRGNVYQVMWGDGSIAIGVNEMALMGPLGIVIGNGALGTLEAEWLGDPAPVETPAEVDGAALLTYVGGDQRDAEYAQDCVDTAIALVDKHIGSADVPAAIRRRGILEAGSELFHRKNAPNGISQFATPDGKSPVRVARDPMLSVYPLLAEFVGMGF